MISIVVAHDKNGLIGRNGVLPWHISEDLKHFRDLTTGSIVIMGRKTYDSIGHPLQDRSNIIISSNMEDIPGCYISNNVQSLINFYKDSENEVFVIGGRSIYEQFLPYANKMYLTVIEGEFVGDVFFPAYNIEQDWECEIVEKHESHPYNFTFINLTRRK